jgi:hypothetical protein
VSWPIFKMGISRTQVQRFNAISIVQPSRCGDYSTPASYFGSQKFVFGGWVGERKPSTPTEVTWFFSVTPSKFWHSNLKLIITRECTNAEQLNFVRWRLTGLISEQVSPSFHHIQKCVKVHTNKVGNSEDYNPLRNSESSTGNLLHVTHFAPVTWTWLLHFCQIYVPYCNGSSQVIVVWHSVLPPLDAASAM